MFPINIAKMFRRRPSRRQQGARPGVESLEERQLLSATTLALVQPTLALTAPSLVASTNLTNPVQILNQPVSLANPVQAQVANTTVLGQISSSLIAATSIQDGQLQIAAKYYALGGPSGFLGQPLLSAAANPGVLQPGSTNPLQQTAVLPNFNNPPAVASGYHQDYQHGSIYWSSKTGAHEIDSAVLTKWLAMGGANGALGYPTTDTTKTADGTGRFNDFLAPSVADGSGASIYAGPTGVFEVQGAIRTKWLSLGGEHGMLGYPTMNDTANADKVGRYLDFQNGSIYWSPATAAHELDGAILNKFGSLGWESGLGYPTGDDTVAPDGVGTFNYFQTAAGSRSAIYVTPATGAHELDGAILQKWAAMGWERSLLGYPVSDMHPTTAGGSIGDVLDFQNGSIFWTAQTGAHEMHGAILAKWLAPLKNLGPNTNWGNTLGYPVSDEMSPNGTNDPSNRLNQFEHGELHYTTQGPANFLAVQVQGTNALLFKWDFASPHEGSLVSWAENGQLWHQQKLGESAGDPHAFVLQVKANVIYSFQVEGWDETDYAFVTTYDYTGWSPTLNYSRATSNYVPPPPPAPTPTPTPIKTPAGPDIRFAPNFAGGLDVDPALPVANVAFTVSWQDMNYGNVEQSYTDVLRLTDQSDGSITYRRLDVDLLRPGMVSELQSASFTLPAGHYIIDVTLDSDEALPETGYNHTFADVTVATNDQGMPKLPGGNPVILQPQGTPAAVNLLSTPTVSALFAGGVINPLTTGSALVGHLPAATASTVVPSTPSLAELIVPPSPTATRVLVPKLQPAVLGQASLMKILE